MKQKDIPLVKKLHPMTSEVHQVGSKHSSAQLWMFMFARCMDWNVQGKERNTSGQGGFMSSNLAEGNCFGGGIYMHASQKAFQFLKEA